MSKSIVFLHEPGGGIVTAEVDLDLDAPGFDVTCLDCGNRAKMLDDPGARGALCPECLIAEVERIESPGSPGHNDRLRAAEAELEAGGGVLYEAHDGALRRVH